MRRVILVEGKKYPDKTLFDPGSLECTEDEVGVVWNFDFQNVRNIVGKARDFQRAEDGTITMEFDVDPEKAYLIENVPFGLRIFADQVTKSTTNGIIAILHCNLRALGMVVQQPWHPGYPDE